MTLVQEEPHEYTKEEIKAKLTKHFNHMIDYWTNTEHCKELAENNPDGWRIAGVVHSIMAVFDGCSLDLPAFQIIPYPCKEDKKYYKENGENWYPYSKEHKNDVGGGLRFGLK